MQGAHLVVYHKHYTSARTRFLRFGHGGICGPDALPRDARLDDKQAKDEATLSIHPGMLLRNVENQLKLARGSLASDIGFRCRLLVAANSRDLYLAHFTSIDPPFDAASAAGGAFIDLTQARGLPSVELALLRLAYEHVLG